MAAPAATAAELPFSVISPTNGSAVASTTPTFTGTGTTGNTVTLTYSGQQLGSYVAGTTTVDEAGAWSTATSFTRANPGETETRVRVEEFAPGVTEAVGTFFITITFPQAPVPAAVFTLESPVEGETRNDLLNIVHFVGEGAPGNIVTVRYFNGRGGLDEAGTTTVGPDGRYDVFATFRGLPAGQDFVNTFTRQTTPAGDLVEREIGRNFFFAVAPVEATPFIVTSPQQGERVDSITPEFTGSGTPGDTVRLTYSGQGLLTYTAGTATIGADGQWVVPETDFSNAAFGATEIRVVAGAFAPSGVERPGGRFVDIVLPEAPADQIDFTLTTPQEGDVIENPRPGVPFIGTGEPGNTIVVQYFKAGGGLAEAGRGTVAADGSFEVNAFFTEVSAEWDFANTFTQQLDADGNRVANEIARLIYFEMSPVVVALAPPTLDEPVVDGTTVTFSGTGVAGATVEVSVVDSAVAAPGEATVFLVAPATLSATVQADGSWTVSDTFEPGDYSATATQFTGDAADRSAATPPVEFSVVAVVAPPTDEPGAPVVTNPVVVPLPSGSAPSNGAGALAVTGADSYGVLALAALLVMTGGAVMVTRRVRLGARG